MNVFLQQHTYVPGWLIQFAITFKNKTQGKANKTSSHSLFGGASGFSTLVLKTMVTFVLSLLFLLFSNYETTPITIHQKKAAKL
jgi:hypothetical protein